jgi:hypothetical protein
MRAHGLADFPDPNASGDIALGAGPGSDLDPNSAKFKAADEACKALRPGRNLSSSDLAHIKAANIKYSQCMRSNGIADFPDPASDGTLQVQATPGSDLDQNNPHFKAAQKACERYMYVPPGGSDGGPSTNSNGGGVGGRP